MHVIAPTILESGVVDEATQTPVADLNLDDTTAALYALPPTKRQPHRRGRRRKKGKRIPAPRHLARRTKGWKTITVKQQSRTVTREVLGVTCLWYHVCRSKPIRLVIVRDPSGRQKDDFFFCTDASTPDEEIVQRYYDRWGVEECFSY